MKSKKCLLLREEVPYLGHVVSSSGIRPDPAKIEKVRSYPTPTDSTKVRQFSGLASYYKRFISRFAKVDHPLPCLNQEGYCFLLDLRCETAFNRLKDCLVTAPVLSYPHFGTDKEFILKTDASGIGLGAVLAQEYEGYPIA